MPRIKVLLTVTTYPLPSSRYDELVCTAGITEGGDWIRIYPWPLSQMVKLKQQGKVVATKYTWVELDLIRRTDDFRPESYKPKDYSFKDLRILDHLDTKHKWSRRKAACLKNVFTNRSRLIAASKDPTNLSLAVFKPTKLLKFSVERDDRDWKATWEAARKLQSLFSEQETRDVKTIIRKLPYKFYYQFEDDEGKRSKMMIEDWEIGQLYWNCLRNAEGDEEIALAKVREKYEVEFFKKDIHLFLGTTKKYHKRAKNPFVIIGVFYPPKELQGSLF